MANDNILFDDEIPEVEQESLRCLWQRERNRLPKVASLRLFKERVLVKQDKQFATAEIEWVEGDGIGRGLVCSGANYPSVIRELITAIETRITSRIRLREQSDGQ